MNTVKVSTPDEIIVAAPGVVSDVMNAAQEVAPFTVIDMKIFMLLHWADNAVCPHTPFLVAITRENI